MNGANFCMNVLACGKTKLSCQSVSNLKTRILPPTSTEHSTKDKAKEKEKKKVREREREKEKKHRVMNEIKRENGEVKQPIKGWWKHSCIPSELQGCQLLVKLMLVKVADHRNGMETSKNFNPFDYLKRDWQYCWNYLPLVTVLS